MEIYDLYPYKTENGIKRRLSAYKLITSNNILLPPLVEIVLDFLASNFYNANRLRLKINNTISSEEDQNLNETYKTNIFMLDQLVYNRTISSEIESKIESKTHNIKSWKLLIDNYISDPIVVNEEVIAGLPSTTESMNDFYTKFLSYGCFINQTCKIEIDKKDEVIQARYINGKVDIITSTSILPINGIIDFVSLKRDIGFAILADSGEDIKNMDVENSIDVKNSDRDIKIDVDVKNDIDIKIGRDNKNDIDINSDRDIEIDVDVKSDKDIKSDKDKNDRLFHIFIWHLKDNKFIQTKHRTIKNTYTAIKAINLMDITFESLEDDKLIISCINDVATDKIGYTYSVIMYDYALDKLYTLEKHTNGDYSKYLICQPLKYHPQTDLFLGFKYIINDMIPGYANIELGFYNRNDLNLVCKYDVDFNQLLYNFNILPDGSILARTVHGLVFIIEEL